MLIKHHLLSCVKCVCVFFFPVFRYFLLFDFGVLVIYTEGEHQSCECLHSIKQIHKHLFFKVEWTLPLGCSPVDPLCLRTISEESVAWILSLKFLFSFHFSVFAFCKWKIVVCGALEIF